MTRTGPRADAGWRAIACAAALAACAPQAPPATPRGDDPGATDAPTPAAAAAAVEVPAPPAAALPPIPTLATSRERLPSGAQVAVLERHDAPLVALRLVVRSGSSSDGEHAGAALVTAHATAAALADPVARLGGELGVLVGPDAAIFSLSVDPRDVGSAVALLGELAKGSRAPGRPEIARASRRLAERAHRGAARDDELGARFVIERDAFDLPTARHPYATVAPTADEIEQVPPAAVRSLLAARYVPAASTLVVVGDARASEVVALADRALGRATSRAPAPIDLPEPFARPADRATVIERGPGPAARVFVGLAAPRADDPASEAALAVTARVVRHRMGGDAPEATRAVRAGPTIVRWSAQAPAERSAEVLPRLRDTLTALEQAMPSESEVARAQRELLGEALRGLATLDGAADRLAGEIAIRGDAEGLAPRLRAVAEVTPALVSLTARDLARAPAHVAATGDASRLGPALAALAEVKVVDPGASFARLRTLPRGRP